MKNRLCIFCKFFKFGTGFEKISIDIENINCKIAEWFLDQYTKINVDMFRDIMKKASSCKYYKCHTHKTKIICGFPGVGKTHFYKNYNKLDIKDSDSSKFSHIDGKKNSQFPENYINHIERTKDAHDYILVSTHPEVIQELLDRELDPILVYPKRESKEKYLKLYKERGSSKEFIEKINKEFFLNHINHIFFFHLTSTLDVRNLKRKIKEKYNDIVKVKTIFIDSDVSRNCNIFNYNFDYVIDSDNIRNINKLDGESIQLLNYMLFDRF